MSKRRDSSPPPSYKEIAVETTPLLRQDYRRAVHQPAVQRPRVVLATILFTFITFTIIFFITFEANAKQDELKVPIRIAIIGAGPAGISTAFTLHSLMKQKGVKINVTIFEEKDGVGGRMLLGSTSASHVQSLPTFSLEDVASGSLLYNRILRGERAEWLDHGVGKSWKKGVKASTVGFFDGESILSVTTRPIHKSSWRQSLWRIFRYGTSVWSARDLPTGTMKTFDKLLNLEATYDNVGQMLAASENGNAVARTAMERLKLNGLSQKYIHEVLGPQVKRHTGQAVEELSDLALSMALDREDQGSQSSEVYGNLASILRGLGDQSEADFRFGTKIQGLRRDMVTEGLTSWILEYTDEESQTESMNRTFDRVIIAAPWNTSTMIRPENSEDIEQIHYRSQWVTLFIANATLNAKYFGSPATLPPQILPIHSSKLPGPLQGIQEVSLVREIVRFDQVTESSHLDSLYRITSDNKIEKSTISQLSQDFDDNAIFYEKEITDAYPLLYARSEGFPSFKVAEGLWHTSVAESIGSSVDLSWVAGENVARLLAKEIAETTGQRDIMATSIFSIALLCQSWSFEKLRSNRE